MVWAIASREREEAVRDWAETFDIDIPVLLDGDGSVAALYQAY